MVTVLSEVVAVVVVAAEEVEVAEGKVALVTLMEDVCSVVVVVVVANSIFEIGSIRI